MLELTAAEAVEANAAAATERARMFLFMRDQMVSVCEREMPERGPVRQPLFLQILDPIEFLNPERERE